MPQPNNVTVTTLPYGCSATWWPGELGAHSSVWKSNFYSPRLARLISKEKQKWLRHMMARIRNHWGSILFKLVPDYNHIRIPGKRQETRKIPVSIRFSCPNASSYRLTNLHKYGAYIQARAGPSKSSRPAIIYVRSF